MTNVQQGHDDVQAAVDRAVDRFGGRRYLDTKDVAERYGVPEATVRKWRHEGTGPAGVRLGRHVRYPITEWERWEQEQLAKQIRASA